jgi:hypothetical protein
MNGRVVAVAYVTTVAGLTARAFWGADPEHWRAEIAAAVLTLPTIIVALPVVYVTLGLVGSATDEPSSGSASSSSPDYDSAAWWPVTLAVTLLMTGVACANFLLVRAVVSRRSRIRSGA